MSLHVPLIDDTAVRPAMIEEGLREAGHERVTVISDIRRLLRQVEDADAVMYKARVRPALGAPARDSCAFDLAVEPFTPEL